MLLPIYLNEVNVFLPKLTLLQTVFPQWDIYTALGDQLSIQLWSRWLLVLMAQVLILVLTLEVPVKLRILGSRYQHCNKLHYMLQPAGNATKETSLLILIRGALSIVWFRVLQNSVVPIIGSSWVPPRSTPLHTWTD